MKQRCKKNCHRIEDKTVDQDLQHVRLYVKIILTCAFKERLTVKLCFLEKKKLGMDGSHFDSTYGGRPGHLDLRRIYTTEEKNYSSETYPYKPDFYSCSAVD